MSISNNSTNLILDTKRHSFAHLMAAAVSKMFPEAQFGVGPVIENGCYYDFVLPRTLIPEDLVLLEGHLKEMLKAHLSFKVQELDIDEAIAHFDKANQPLKVELLMDLKTKGTTSMSEEEKADFEVEKVLPREVAAELTEGVQTKPKQIITFENKITSIQFLGNSQTKEEHRLAVLDTIEQIKMGNTFQAEVGFKTEYKITGDKIAIYNELRKVNPSPYMYYLKFSERELFGCSPELLIACTKGRISTSPLAGTIHRGKDEIQDRQLVRKLLTNPKEIAEHKMLVDLHRNDIAKVSKIGSVKVADLMYIVKFSNVQHIASDITGELVDGKDSLDVLSCILPGGVLTGAPKIETIKIIAKNEKTPRGPYGGAVGRLSYNGDCAFALPIRSLFCNGDNCFAQTCGGIVLDSDPESEYQEIRNKLAAMDNTIKNIKI